MISVKSVSYYQTVRLKKKRAVESLKIFFFENLKKNFFEKY